MIAKATEICLELLQGTSSLISLRIINLADDHHHRHHRHRDFRPLYRQNYLSAEQRRDFGSFIIHRQNYLAAEHRRDFGCFIIQTELPRR